jgi:hypothetical protein
MKRNDGDARLLKSVRDEIKDDNEDGDRKKLVDKE